MDYSYQNLAKSKAFRFWYDLVAEQAALEHAVCSAEISANDSAITVPNASVARGSSAESTSELFGWEPLVKNHYALRVSCASEVRHSCEQCKYAMVMPSQQDDHELLCEGATVKCVLIGCRKEYVRRDFDQHMQRCEMNVLRCGFCSMFVHRKDYFAHNLAHSMATDFYDWDQTMQEGDRYYRDNFIVVNETSEFWSVDEKTNIPFTPPRGSGARVLPAECERCGVFFKPNSLHTCGPEREAMSAISRQELLLKPMLQTAVEDECKELLKPTDVRRTSLAPMMKELFDTLHTQDLWASSSWFWWDNNAECFRVGPDKFLFAEKWDRWFQKLLRELLADSNSGSSGNSNSSSNSSSGRIVSGCNSSSSNNSSNSINGSSSSRIVSGSKWNALRCSLPTSLLEIVMSYCSLIDFHCVPAKKEFREDFVVLQPWEDPPGDCSIFNIGERTINMGLQSHEDRDRESPNVVGRNRYNVIFSNHYKNGIKSGGSAVWDRGRGRLVLRYPIARGVVQDWDDMALSIQSAFYNVFGPQPFPVLITEKAQCSREQRERFTSLFFEEYGIPALCVALDSVLGLFGQGALSGTVLKLGEGVTSVVPIYQGVSQRHLIQRQNMGMRDIMADLGRLLAPQRVFGSSTDWEALRAVMIHSSRHDTSGMHELPDGHMIRLSHEEFRQTFTPLASGAAKTINNSLTIANASMRSWIHDLYPIGMPTAWLGFDALLEEQMSFDRIKPIIVSPRAVKREDAVWIGGSIFSRLSTFDSYCLSLAEYNECGASAIHRYANMF